MKTQKYHRLKKILLMAAILSIVAVCSIMVMDYRTEREGAFIPDYEMVDLQAEVQDKDLTAEQYDLLFKQTGLAKAAVDKLLQEQDDAPDFSQYQEDFFHSDYGCEKIGIITKEERVRDTEGNPVAAFTLVDVQDGDVFLTKATHSLGWRHGHAALVIDAEAERTVESVVWGQPSNIQSVKKWQTYPSVIQLRVRDDVLQELGYERKAFTDEITSYAAENMADIDYGLIVGLLPGKAKADIAKTQCAHLVWYVYNQFGMEIDSDGGWLVTPCDIANSPIFEVIQVYGVNPDEIWP